MESGISKCIWSKQSQIIEPSLPPKQNSIPSLKLTAGTRKMDGWKTFSFPFWAWILFKVRLLLAVSFRECGKSELQTSPDPFTQKRLSIGILIWQGHFPSGKTSPHLLEAKTICQSLVLPLGVWQQLTSCWLMLVDEWSGTGWFWSFLGNLLLYKWLNKSWVVVSNIFV